MFRNRVQLHDGSAVQKGYGLQAVECRHRGTRTCVDEDSLGGECKLAAVFCRTSSDLAPVKLASPKINSRFAVFSMRPWLPLRKLFTISRLRCRTRSMSIRMSPV